MNQRRQLPVRPAVWLLHLALPALGLWLLLTRPALDVVLEHHPGHFWLVMAVAAINVGLGLRISRAARRREDGRLFLVSLAFIAAAAFLLLHALATPGVLLDRPNTGFVLATPVGLFVGAVLALASSPEFTAGTSHALLRYQGLLYAGLAVLVFGWAVVSLLKLPPLDVAPTAEARGPLVMLVALAVVLYLAAALRYLLLYRRHPGVMLISVITAFTLLAEATIATALAPNWHLSWWEWHVLMVLAFGYVAYSAFVQYQRDGSAAGLFDGIATSDTERRVRGEYTTALETLVDAMRRGEHGGWTAHDLDLITAGVAARFELGEGQARVLSRAAGALAAEREQIRRLDALVAIGAQTAVEVGEPELLGRSLRHLGAGFVRDHLRVGLVRAGRLEFPRELSTVDPRAWPADAPTAGYPLLVKGHRAGVLQVCRPSGELAERDHALLRSLASQLSMALENTRLYRQLDELFRAYLSPDVAAALLADPSQAALGGAVVEVTSLFADLRGFTTFSEASSPASIVTMLNQLFGAATPCVLDSGGTIVQFVGDAMMALFNAPVRQPDHALRAASAALHMQLVTGELAAANAGWPRFRIGVNTGQALVGNIGSPRLRSFNAMGDAVNVAARLESIAEPGQVVIGESTYLEIAGLAQVRPLGELALKGRRARTRAYVLTALSNDVPSG